MLKLSNIKKSYKTGETTTEALKGISIEFRKSEFVSVLGPSGCGKTTLLNIVGGLDRYNSGDLIIDETSTKEYKDKDWDNYRNHSVGFVFQSYNLIPHQTVLENVEIALTLSGVSKKERKERATKVLKKVGLGDKLKNKPNQLSGGQMQRVAIARALVNDPEIILADEPTGALDSKTSVQIMEILKEISKDKLIVMVTHNPELAEKYSSRIVRLKDGKIVGDTNPFTEKDLKEEKEQKQEKPKKSKYKKAKMSFFTALSLSFKNLLTKKARTILVSFAGSIGIIGIALVLAISSGFNAYVEKTQRNTLSSYPVEITNSDYNISSLMQIFLSNDSKQEKTEDGKVGVKEELTDLLTKFNESNVKNDIASFKKYLEGDGKEEIEKLTTDVQYVYGQGVNPYFERADNTYINTNSTELFMQTITKYSIEHPEIAVDAAKDKPTTDQGQRLRLITTLFAGGMFFDSGFWSEMIDNQKVLDEQYDLVCGNYPSKATEVVVVVDENNQISDYTLYGLGLLEQDKLTALMDDYINGKENKGEEQKITYKYDELMQNTYKIVLTSEFFQKGSDDNYADVRLDPTKSITAIQDLYEGSEIEITVSGIIRPKDKSNASISTCIGYTKELTQLIIEKNNQKELVQGVYNETNLININTKEKDADDNFIIATDPATVLSLLNYIDLESPIGVNLYPQNFDSKTSIVKFINSYNDKMLAEGEDSKVITYSDTVGQLMSSISVIISAITYILIAFVSVSLIVSSIMIGIITYISVIERTKEIGVLRSVGASKKDIKNVFTAESFIIGLTSGVLGILISLLLLIPINIVLNALTNLGSIAMLPWLGAIILILISVFLTFIAGLIPARAAAKKDPVIALRAS